MSQAMRRGERRREVCMGLTDTSPEAGQTTAGDPLCPWEVLRTHFVSSCHPEAGTEPLSRRPPDSECTHSGASTPEGIGKYGRWGIPDCVSKL